jgi:hypothetical protein
MITTGHRACRATWSPTDPIVSRSNPPAPRVPTTIMSASAAALTSVSAGTPVTALTMTSGRGPPNAASALSVAACAAALVCSTSSASPG